MGTVARYCAFCVRNNSLKRLCLSSLRCVFPDKRVIGHRPLFLIFCYLKNSSYHSYLRFAPNDLILRRLCIPRGNSGTSHSALGSQWQIAFVVADFAKGFRHAEIKRSIAPPLPIRAKSRRRLWGPRLNQRATKASALPIRA